MKSSKELLREFYYYAEQLSQNDEMLGAINSAYCQIANELDLLNTILKYVYIDSQSLKFKGISFKRNKQDFDKIVAKIRKENKE